MKKLFLFLFISVVLLYNTYAELPNPPRGVRIKYATTNQLEVTTLAPGEIIVNQDDYSDVRIGDGQTPGGIRIGDTLFNDNTGRIYNLGGATAEDIKTYIALTIGDQYYPIYNAVLNEADQRFAWKNNPTFPNNVTISGTLNLKTNVIMSTNSYIAIGTRNSYPGNLRYGKKSVSIGESHLVAGPNSVAIGTWNALEGAGANSLLVGNNVSVNSYNCLSVGQNVKIGDNCINSIALGECVYIPNDYFRSFVWSGISTDSSLDARYKSHNPGTFNINPTNGTDGFYIGETNLTDHIKNISSNNLPISTTDSLGVVKVGDNLNIAADGTLSVPNADANAGTKGVIYLIADSFGTTSEDGRVGYATTEYAVRRFIKGSLFPYPIFQTTSTYNIGDRVQYKSYIYECLEDNTTGVIPLGSSKFKVLDPLQTQIDEHSEKLDKISSETWTLTLTDGTVVTKKIAIYDE